MTAQIVSFPGCEPKQLPRRSGQLDPDVFQYWLDLIRRKGKQHAAITIRILSVDGIRLKTEADEKNGYFPGGHFEALDMRSRISRLYWERPESVSGHRLRWIAEKNAQNLMSGRINPEFQDEALEEIEHQMNMLAPGFRKWGERELAFLSHLREWKQTRGIA